MLNAVGSTELRDVFAAPPYVAKAMEDVARPKNRTLAKCRDSYFLPLPAQPTNLLQAFASFGSRDHSAFERPTSGRPTYG